jgi:hypothetical protein
MQNALRLYLDQQLKRETEHLCLRNNQMQTFLWNERERWWQPCQC